ncbi:MAG TPA: Crp/Fnr family transcriptional regulator [Clostridiales bacterium]|nr:Crp/Fnr family transcriptional regulator [Clostridiales bacterium]
MSCNCNHDQSDNCIKRVPIFSHLTEEEMIEVSLITTEKTYQKGEYIYSQEDIINKIFVIHSGKIRIYRLSHTGKEQVIRILEHGDFMGELSLFSPQPATDYAVVTEDATMCVIDGEKLKKLMLNYTAISFKILEEISHRLEKAENLIEDINLHSVEQRIADALLDMVNEKGIVNLNMSKGDLASQLGMTQETLSRKLSLFQEEKLIKLEGQRIIRIMNKEGLDYYS